MFKQLGIIICLVLFAGVYAFAQDTVKTERPQEIQKPQETLDQQDMERQQESTSWNTVCPVDGEPVTGEAPTVRHNGKTYGFDKPSCAVVFSDEPETYARNLNEDGTQFARERTGEPEEEKEL